MSKLALGIGVPLSVALMILVFMSLRAINTATVSVQVRTVEPGVNCAVATSADGVAINCWRVGDE